MNSIKTFVLLLALTVLFLFIGQSIGGRDGLVSAFIFVGIMNFIAYWFSDKIVLAMYGAKEVKPEQSPELFSIVDSLTKSANLPMPKVYIIPIETPNAFATGRDPKHAAVAVTEGILRLLSREELSGVLAHELSHVKNRDTLIQVVAATIAGAIMMLARIAQYAAIFGGGGDRRDRDNNGGGLGLLLVAIIAPLAAIIIQMAISRTREYHADAGGAKICGKPLSLAQALKKLEEYGKRIPMLNSNPSTAHLFIVNPLSGKAFLNLFSTHPPISERVRRLENIATEISGYKIPKIIY